MRHSIRVGDRVKAALLDWRASGTVVEIFKAGQTPPADKVQLYYGKKGAETLKSIFGPLKIDRIIFRKDNGYYVVSPAKYVHKV